MEVKLPDDTIPSTNSAQLPVQLQRCEDEPIRIPGSIQRHGFLLLLNSFESHIVGASENTEEFLEVPLQLVLGAEIDSIFEREVLSALRALAHLGERPSLVTYLGAFQMRGRLYSVVTHQVESQRIVEFELLDRLVSPDMTNQVFTNFVGMLSQLRTEQELCDALARQVRDLTHFNRVMLYRFDEFGHGTVLSEENDGSLPSYLGLRFPASDIPQQARDLYVLNTVRIIPDATYVPSPLHGVDLLRTTNKLSATEASAPAGKITTLDLSNAMLRSVSPIHVEYMRNMGTLSSMSISIVCEGKLWGLISGHHGTPHTVPYLVRSACDLLTKLVCTQLASLLSDASLKKMVHFHGVQRRVLTQMAADNSYLNAMADQMDQLIQIADAGGVALVIDGHCRTFGITPNETSISRLAEWMDESRALEVFESRSLATQIGWAADFSEVASGLLAIRISYASQSYLMWFRPEILRTVNWAGEPVPAEAKARTLHPRSSFATWKEEVRGTSAPWTKMEIDSAKDFRGAVITISLKRAEEAIQLGEARFLQLTHALPHPVWTADDDGELTYVNQRWLDEGLQSRGRWYEQEAILKEDWSRCAEAWNQAVADGIAFDMELRFFPESKKAGRWNLVRAVPFRANGTRAGWVGTCTDLTDRRQREAALRMTEKLALTGRMTSVIAHEINNPLEALTNLLYLLSGHVAGDDEARNYIGLAEGELQRISGITKQTLRWAREDLLQPEYGFAGNLIADVLRLYAGQIKNKGINVCLENQEDVRVYGTLGQITQVLANLISNAVQAAPVGGTIWLSYAAQPDSTEFNVRDNGHGMSEETLRNLFQPFYSTKGDLGNGLGLYISQEIIERHGGTITVQSVTGKGTDIRFRLPTGPISRPALSDILPSMKESNDAAK
jgi:light-regulated signal transduction histidine kinase (bacteriophytochrome)